MGIAGRFDTETGEVELLKTPDVVAGGRTSSSRPYGIKIDSEGHPWIVLFNINKIATVDPESMHLKTFDLPDEGSRPRLSLIHI